MSNVLQPKQKCLSKFLTSSTPALEDWTGLTDSLLKNGVWKGDNSSFTAKKGGRHCLNQVIMVNITSDKSCPHHVLM